MADGVDPTEVGRVWFGPGDPLHLRVPHLLPRHGKPKQDLPLRRQKPSGEKPTHKAQSGFSVQIKGWRNLGMWRS
jgi:hypothetical protein